MANATSEAAVSLTEALVKTVAFTSAAAMYHHWVWALCSPVFFFLAVKTVLRTEPPEGSNAHASLQHAEGRLKQQLARLQSHAESVSMLQGEPFELDLLQKSVRDVSTLAKKRCDVMFFMEMAEKMLFHSSQSPAMIELAAFFFTAFLGAKGVPTCVNPSQGSELAAVHVGRQLRDVQGFFNACAGWATFLGARTLLMNCGPATSRVKQLYSRLERLQAQSSEAGRSNSKRRATPTPPKVQQSEVFLDRGPILSFEAVTIQTPSKQVLFRDITFSVAEGRPLLIVGQDGAGKSAIARCLFSLWPVNLGQIARPGGAAHVEDCIPLPENIVYLPERPLIGACASLSRQITWPLTGGLTGGQLLQWLRYVDLQYLLEGTGGDVESDDLASLLSLREQQALGFARLLYNRPRFAILDESSSALSMAQETNKSVTSCTGSWNLLHDDRSPVKPGAGGAPFFDVTAPGCTWRGHSGLEACRIA